MNKELSQKLRIISFLSILLVVLLHGFNLEKVMFYQGSYVWIIEDFFSNGFTRIAVPIFFLTSGFFHFQKYECNRDYVIKIYKKKTSTLIIPFVFWSFFGLIFYITLQSIPQLLKFFTKKLIINYSFHELLLSVFVNPIPYQLWFLRDLTLLVFISPIIYFLIKKAPLISTLIFLNLWLFISIKLQNSSEALLFFFLGGVISYYNPNFLKKNLYKNNFVMIVLWFSLILCSSLIRYYNYDLLLIRVVLKFSILVGIVSFWGWYDLYENKLVKNNFINRGLQYTFFIYVFHEPTLTICKKILLSFFGHTKESYLLVYFLSVFFTILFSLKIGYLFKTYFTKLYNITTGNR